MIKLSMKYALMTAMSTVDLAQTMTVTGSGGNEVELTYDETN